LLPNLNRPNPYLFKLILKARYFKFLALSYFHHYCFIQSYCRYLSPHRQFLPFLLIFFANYFLIVNYPETSFFIKYYFCFKLFSFYSSLLLLILPKNEIKLVQDLHMWGLVLLQVTKNFINLQDTILHIIESFYVKNFYLSFLNFN